jgi:hypothetical protein
MNGTVPNATVGLSSGTLVNGGVNNGKKLFRESKPKPVGAAVGIPNSKDEMVAS